ncbi:MAG: aspartate-semialdehyde dehydrogenase [Gammaproteobacteria bacterium]|nr:MAG: aspartate-semialdehyde dehydrogenase [Gammaproteobacteria bacterium]
MSNRVAIVGATGLVGQAILSILEQRSFPVEELIPLASERSAGKSIRFNDQDYEVMVLDDFNFENIDFSFFSAGSSVSRVFAPKAANAGSVVIDNTSEFRYDDQIPLIVPEVNAHALENFRKNNIIANPNCSTIQMLVALNPIHKAATISSINVCTYQSISGAGRMMLNEYDRQVSDPKYPQQEENCFAHNVIPQIGSFENNGYSLEEMKMVWETHKIFDDKNIEVNPTAVRVPVRYGHSEAISIITENHLSVGKVRALLSDSNGIQLMHDDESYPMPIKEGEGTDDVYVGRIRADLNHSNGINLWVVADNIRKGAALNSIQIAETILESNY